MTMSVRGDSNGVHLTAREREILRLIAEEIAASASRLFSA